MKQTLRDLREKAGLSRYDLAVKVKATPNSIVNWESGESKPSVDSVHNLAKVFGLTMDDIFLSLPTTKIVKNKEK